MTHRSNHLVLFTVLALLIGLIVGVAGGHYLLPAVTIQDSGDYQVVVPPTRDATLKYSDETGKYSFKNPGGNLSIIVKNGDTYGLYVLQSPADK
ncbi:hypothetical protein [Lacticaseibacillus yichunensis]|uniref:Uncharacterized protein n=1 Tax=Lacticaseibacillus yichunensis TaxID=2486015 RepID=A0ABW4CQ86_9LACO|nr:hypothetical protein [Lacticaseibacillus yichunensis]